MKKEEINTFNIRKKRSAVLHLIISLSCICMIIFILFSLIKNIFPNNNNNNDNNSKTETSVSSDPGNDSSSDIDNSSSSEKDSSKDPSSSEKDKSEDDFSDAVFIGSSRTEGLRLNCDKPMASFYCATGLNVDTVNTNTNIPLDNGDTGTVFDALKQKQFSRIYIEFGINELSWPAKDVFVSKYEEFIEKVKELQPDAHIYVQSELPVSSKALNTDECYTNDNIDDLNQNYIKKAAENTNSVYIDINSDFKDENKSLPEDASTDGIHLQADYLHKWINLIAEKTKNF